MDSNNFIPEKDSPSRLVHNLLSESEQLMVFSIIRAGYQLEKHFVDTVAPDWLTFVHATKLYPEFKNMAVEFSLIQACDKHVIPFNYDIETIPQNGIHYVLLTSTTTGAVLTINQTPTSKRASRYAKYRANLHDDQFHSQLVLFSDQKQKIETPYLELNHGYQSAQPDFVVLGKPEKSGEWQALHSISGTIQVLNNKESEEIKTTAKQLAAFSPEEFSNFQNQMKKDE